MKHIKMITTLVLALCLLAVTSGCTAKTAGTIEPTTPAETTAETTAAETRESITQLQCIQPTALNTLRPASGSQVVAIWEDYETDRTTVTLVDVNTDTVCREATLDGVWNLKEQSFSDGRFALCNRETNTWRFLSASLEPLGTWEAENVDGFFSYDGNTYYYLSDHVLCWKGVNSGESGKVALPLDLRLLELTAFDAESGTLVMQFYLSPYSSECGTAVYDMTAGTFTMLQRNRYRAFFQENGVSLLRFDNEKMGYCVTYGSGGEYLFADAGIFSNSAGDLYAIPDSPYLMGIGIGRSILYAEDRQIKSCSLSDCGINGEMYTVCYLPDEGVVVGAVYQKGAFRLYVIDPAQIPFTEVSNAAQTDSPFVVDASLVQTYWNTVSGAPVAESLQDARKYADTLEEKYSIKILLSSQCYEPALLCDRVLTLTDTLSPEEELKRIMPTLEALDRSLAMYPKGFPAQFRNGAGDGGLCYLLVAGIEKNSNKHVVGCAYDRFDWQYIALDVLYTGNMDGVVCHETWHATENYIFSKDFTALPMDEWDSLNPEGFSYTDDYAKQDPTQPWLLYTSIPEEIHFVDAYACVNRQEDRARIMEYIMAYEDEAKILIQSPYFRQKLQMMCDAVRDNFDTTGWEDVRWERFQK